MAPSTLLIAIGIACQAMAVDATWVFNGDGDWSERSKWSVRTVPDSSDVNVLIDDGDSAVTVTLTGSSRTISRLAVGPDDTLGIIDTRLSATNDIGNQGAIILTGRGVIPSLALNGMLNNSETGLLRFEHQQSSVFFGDLTNQGTVLVNGPTRFEKYRGTYINHGRFTVLDQLNITIGAIEQASGVMELEGSLILDQTTFTLRNGTLKVAPGGSITIRQGVQTIGRFNYLGGTIDGTPVLGGVVLGIGPQAIAPASLLFVSGYGDNFLMGDVHADQTLTLQSTGSALLQLFTDSFTNDGSIVLTSATTSDAESHLWVNGTLTNGLRGLLHFQPGGPAFRRSFHGDLVNNGTVLVETLTTFPKSGGMYTNNGHFIVPTGGSLDIINGGTLVNSGLLTVADGGTLAVQSLTVDAPGEVRGKGRLVGSVANGGRIAPGASPGILRIDGNYTQSSSGVLEIEVGGLAPGTEHDQLVVSGSATLSGRLEVPIFGNYLPTEKDEVTFLTAASVEGTFGAIFSPNLASVNPNLAIDVLYDNPQNVRLRFVQPSTDIRFVAQEPESNWTGFGTWTDGEVPDSTNIVTVNNLSGAPQQVNVTHGSAFVHQLKVDGATDVITLSIQNGSSFSATAGVIVENKGIIELDQANLISSQVEIQSGGVLGGNGRVVGNVVVGAARGEANATLRPGLLTGHLDIEGNYQQGPGGTLAIEIQGTGSGQFDTMTVSGEATLGGTLLVDASRFELAAPGIQLPVLAAGSVANNSVFERVETIGNEDIFFAPIYETVASGAELAQGSSLAAGMSLGGFLEGDMNLNGLYDSNDVPIFALALTKPETYFDQFFIEGNQSGDIDDNGILDFDDIDNFAGLIPGASVGAVAAAIEAELYGVPEPASLVFILLGGFLASADRFHRSPCQRPTAPDER